MRVGVLLVTSVVIGGWLPAVISTLIGAGFTLLWFVLPLRIRERPGESPVPDR